MAPRHTQKSKCDALAFVDCGLRLPLVQHPSLRVQQSAGIEAVCTSDECEICGLHRPCRRSHEHAARRNWRLCDLAEGEHLLRFSSAIEDNGFHFLAYEL